LIVVESGRRPSTKQVFLDIRPWSLDVLVTTGQNLFKKLCRISGVYDNRLRGVFRTCS
jgi:hypothetical protein